MENYDLHQLKVFAIKSYKILKRRQEEFFKELEQDKRADDLLTVKQVSEQYSVSAKTVYRWRDNGLECLQSGSGGKLLTKREELENYIKTNRYGRSL